MLGMDFSGRPNRWGWGEPNAMALPAEPAPLRAYDEPKLGASGPFDQVR
jgi:hypothetical protein